MVPEPQLTRPEPPHSGTPAPAHTAARPHPRPTGFRIVRPTAVRTRMETNARTQGLDRIGIAGVGGTAVPSGEDRPFIDEGHCCAEPVSGLSMQVKAVIVRDGGSAGGLGGELVTGIVSISPWAVRVEGDRAAEERSAEDGQIMRSITPTMSVTLDGVVQGLGRPDEDTRGGFAHGGREPLRKGSPSGP